ncbi:VOC family protein [Listeria ivanovii]|uniref:VOC family protein n=1 Tax=Listeria ivanovii TaxID=1638 RepID=UPI0005127AC1|nr:VOC family protein [Listeria ivanovii]AIS62010.1 glyoxalase [Listeria ivanovii subsp. londoniensis]MBK1965623.1 VOC family protein [Listeria ivanovii subsp. londoniensis]MBK1983449.1 VOC family protein [Listeria ivanovii subsp. londoniensis]MBK1994791.1 VOC family protein [Listeria ivanovii subsp. londoniensis]
MIQGIHHISALTKSFTLNHHFYSDILGLRLVKNTVNQANIKMRHLFYGDYAGTPGTLLTFFEVPKIGSSYYERSYFGNITLGIPKDTTNYWEKRLTDFTIPFEKTEKALILYDPDRMGIILMEIAETTSHPTIHTDIVSAKQIVRILGADYHVPSPIETSQFFTNYFGLESHNGVLVDSSQMSFTRLYKTRSEKKSRTGRGTIDHIAYTVKTKEAVDKLHKIAFQNKLKIEEFVDREYFKSLYIKEPSGLRIEFASAEPGFTLDEPLETLGEKLALPSFLEEKRTEIETYFGGEK